MRRALLIGGVLAAVGGLFLLLGRGENGAVAAAGTDTVQPPTAGHVFEPDLGLPATGVVAFGSSPGESTEEETGEVWAYGELGAAPIQVEGKSYSNQYALLRRTAEASPRTGASPTWQVVPLEGSEGKPLAPAGESGPGAYGALAGQATYDGGIVLLSGQSIIARNPGEKPALVPEPQPAPTTPGEGDEHGLAAGESLLPTSPGGSATVPYAAIEEEGQAAGVLIAPYHDGGKSGSSGAPEAQPGVLHFQGHQWTREEVQAQGEELKHFTALAMSCAGTKSAPQASSPENCWLLTGYGASEVEHLGLYRRVSSAKKAGWAWQRQPVSDWMLGSAALPHGVSQANISPLPQGAQMLTATAQGVWVDFEVRVNGLATPVYASEMVLAPEGGTSEQAQVGGTWCYPTGTVCSSERSLGAPLPARYRSFAWPGTSSSELGTRVITGLPGRAMLELAGGNFSYMAGAGGEPGLDPGGAAFYHSSGGSLEGWVADGVYKENDGPDGEGQSQAIAVTAPSQLQQEPTGDIRAQGDQLQQEPVPFRHPLLAVAQAPGTTSGNPNAEALAVGVDGEVGRYVPGEGWHPEGLYNSAGEAQPVVLRGVAWPESNRAYAVGDDGNMWLWMKETGYWVPDPAKPFNFIGNLTAIAFQPGHPQVGYAVGKQGVLLRYGKSWAQISKAETEKLEQELKIEEWRLNFTSIAFAGQEALATYREVIEEPGTGQVQAGGLLVNEGSGWHVDESAAALLGHLPAVRDTVLSKVAGLSDGGAVAGGPDVMMERESPSAPWRMSQTPLAEARNISALAAYREADGAVRAIASIDLDRSLDPGLTDGNLTHGPFKGDVPASTGAGQPPPFIPPDPLPDSGYLLKETSSGWVDMEHEALPTRSGAGDMPIRPDPVFAMLVEPSGQVGLAVGGQTYDSAGGGPEEKAETASAMRFPAGAGQDDAQASSIAAPAGQASFVVGGDADCDEACATLANESIGPDVWLTHALQTATHISGARGVLYTGGRVPVSVIASEGLSGFERELERFRELLDAAGPLQVYTTASRETEPVGIGSGPFERIVLPHGDGVRMCTEAEVPCEPGTSAYSFTSEGSSGGPVKVIVLDFSNNDSLETPGASHPHAQEEWLEAELQAAAHEPAIVMGYDSLGFSLPDQSGSVGTQAADAQSVARILVKDEASAYIFDYPGVNVEAPVSWQGKSIPAFGSGTLGSEAPGSSPKDSLASSAFLLLSVNAAKSEPGMPHVAQVSATAVPNVGQLSLNATNGTLLRRSKPALFEALARRPPAGMVVGGANISTQGVLIDPDAYDPIPTDCQGPNCSYEVPIEYTYSSSKPDVGNFVAHESASASTVQIKLGANGKPIPDSKSGLFCAYNEGTTTVSITAGGLTYSMPVTVQGGSSEQPCGTVPLEHPPARYETSNTPFVVPNTTTAPSTAPLGAQINNLVPPPPPKLPHQLPPAPLLLTNPAALFAIPPPPLSVASTTPQPTPPSGTAQVPAQSPVAQQVSVAEREEEVEGAYQHVHNMAAYEHPEGESFPTWPIALIVIAAAAGAGLRPRRDRDSPAYAWVRGFRNDL